MTLRTIRAGCTFVARDPLFGEITLTGGQQIEIDDDVAASHADKLEPLDVQTPAQPDAPATDG